MIKKNKKEVSYNTLVSRNKTIQQLKREGVLFIYPKKKRFIAYSIISLGVITFILPCGSIVLIILGLSMLGLSKYKIIMKLRNKYVVFRYKLRSKRERVLK